MNSYVMDGQLEETAGTAGALPAKPLTLVVGYDGSEPARHALERAISILHERRGSLEVVFVAPPPVTASVSAQPVGEVQQGFDQQAATLAHNVREMLLGSHIVWHFQRRDGIVEEELIAAADEQTRAQDYHSDVTIVVGGSSHWHHRLAGSVAPGISRQDRFPLLVQP